MLRRRRASHCDRAPGDALAVGRRVFLRRPRPDDADPFLRFVRESRRLHRPWVTPPATPEAFRAFVERSDTETNKSFLVCTNEGSSIAGVYTLGRIYRRGVESAYLGYYGSARHSGHGYMSESLELLLQFAFETLGLHRLEANIQPENEPSLKLVKRAGFRPEDVSPRHPRVFGGRSRGHERWTLTAQEWRRRRKERAVNDADDA